MASAAVTFTVDALAPRDAAVQLNLRLEAADASTGKWRRVREDSVTLKDVNIVSQLNRAQYAYRLSLWPQTASDTQQTAAFPFFLEIPALPASPSSSEEGDMCPPEIGAFAIAADQLQCHAEEQAPDSTSASQAAAMFGGTLAAALLVYSLLPYVRARNRKRRRSRSRTHSQAGKDRLSRSSGLQEGPTTPTTPNGASRRMWGSLDDDGIEPARAFRDELRERKHRQPEATGRAGLDAGSELELAKLPDFNDERGWRDFFDSQIYHNEPQEEQRAATKTFSSIKNRGEVTAREFITATRHNLRQTEATTTSATTPRSGRYRAIRDRIDRAAMEAAIDEAHTFNEFWQM
ncbi:hypothetical protein PHYPSEUDO_009389 [Phytophthora pseudosyringae]|uniref:Uncharacterized protein n=1 Tax=Phytophthora pseudosyringae TaxID=221518 RepID=A0A8T1W970_9STRA|nr:hypothetical protein PHYPSEUDO_009389 [Phytophthora pseudosyringae]